MCERCCPCRKRNLCWFVDGNSGYPKLSEIVPSPSKEFPICCDSVGGAISGRNSVHGTHLSTAENSNGAYLLSCIGGTELTIEVPSPCIEFAIVAKGDRMICPCPNSSPGGNTSWFWNLGWSGSVGVVAHTQLSPSIRAKGPEFSVFG